MERPAMSSVIEFGHQDSFTAQSHGGAQALQRHLAIGQPEIAADTPPILSFQRKREIDIPWQELGGYGSAAAAIRARFEESWNFPHGLQSDWSGAQVFNRLIKPVPPAGVFAVTEKRDEPTKFTAGVLIQYGVNPPEACRLYLLIAAEGQTLKDDDFQTFERYDAVWSKIAGLKLVFENPADAKAFYTEFEEVDLRPALIVRRYQELSRLLECATGVRDGVTTINKGLIDQYVKDRAHADEIAPLRQQMMRLDLDVYDVQRQIDRLVAAAARLGYLLFVEKAVRNITAGGKAISLQPGTLYTTQRRTAFWTEYVHVKWAWLFGGPSVHAIPRQEVYDDYQAVDVTRDRYNEMRGRHLAAGRRVFTFEPTPSGFVSTEGVPLRQIMDRCRGDEAFRRTCVVVLPVYEDSLTGERLLTKYSVFIRPLPAFVPTMPLRISLAEWLSYRIAWQGTQLGELVNTINLAPGEERRVTITKRFEQETNVTRSSTSIFDISRSDTSDLATEMENQSRQEKEHSSKFEFSSSVSGSYFGVTAEASASGGTTSSLKDVSQAMSKVAKKASQAISQQNRQEISTAASSRTSIANTEETVATIRNINQGRSLNLMFYRLCNTYSGGLFLDDLRFDVLPGIEMIAGSGVYESKSYHLGQLANVIDEFRSAGLDWSEERRQTYTKVLYKTIDALLRAEYDRAAGAPPDATGRVLLTGMAGTDIPVTSAGVVSLSSRSFGGATAATDRGATAGANVVLLQQAKDAAEAGPPPDPAVPLREITIHSKHPMVPEQLIVAAPGFYLDAVVGALPSTEPYSEAMREQEVRMRQAEILLKASEAVYNRAKAAAELRTSDGINFVTGVLPNPAQKRLAVSVWNPLSAGEWTLLVDGHDEGAAGAVDGSRHIVEFAWNQPQPWLEEPASLLSRIALSNKGSGERIACSDRLATIPGGVAHLEAAGV
jgi:hypothetical protein